MLLLDNEPQLRIEREQWQRKSDQLAGEALRLSDVGAREYLSTADELSPEHPKLDAARKRLHTAVDQKLAAADAHNASPQSTTTPVRHSMPVLLLVAPLAALPAVRLIQVRRRARRLKSNLCPACGYDLRATPARCPECGAEATAHGR